MLELKNINVSFRSERQDKIFGHTRQQVLFDVSLAVKEGTCLGILGESGSGKSTMGRVSVAPVEHAAGAVGDDDVKTDSGVFDPFPGLFGQISGVVGQQDVRLPVPDGKICKTNSVSCFRITRRPQIPGSAFGILLGKV